MTGFTFPGIMEDPGCNAGRLISKIPVRGPDVSYYSYKRLPKGPLPEPWSDPLVDALKEKFSAEIIKAYSFIGQNQIEIGKGR